MSHLLFVYRLILPFLIAVLFSASVQAEQLAEKSSDHWGFSLTTYAWLPGVNGKFSVGSNSRPIDASFIDIVDKSRRFPLAFNGRFEAHYDRFAFYLDGNYMNIKLKPRFDRISDGVNAELGIMDYGLMYRIFGANPSEMRNYQGKKRPNVLDVYAGARTIWMGSSLLLSSPLGLVNRTPTANTSFTSPIIGGRIGVDLTPDWFVMVDGNIGGFGAQSVELTSNLLGVIGYRTAAFDVPVSIEAGYKALYYKVDKNGPTSTNVTLHGPFIGFTGYW